MFMFILGNFKSILIPGLVQRNALNELFNSFLNERIRLESVGNPLIGTSTGQTIHGLFGIKDHSFRAGRVQ